MDADLAEWAREMDEHLAADPVLQRAARGEPVTAGDLDPVWQRVALAAALIVFVALGVVVGLLIPV